MSTFNNLETVVKEVATKIDAEMPIVSAVMQDMSNEYTNTSGETIYMSLPDYGAGATSGVDATSTTGAVHLEKIPVTISCKHDAVNLNILESAFKAGNAKTQIMEPRIQHLGSDIEADLLNTIFLGAGSAEIKESGTGDYKDLRKVAARVYKSRLRGEVYAAMDFSLGAEVKDSGVAYFQASSLDKTFGTRAYGDVEGVKIIGTQDISNLITGNHTLGSGTTMKVKTEVNTDGASSIVLKVAGGTATLTGAIKKGEIIFLKDATSGAYVNGTNVYRKSNGVKFPFIAQADATASGNELTVTVQKLYFTATDARKNVDVTTLPVDMVAEFGHTASSVYKKCALWAKPSVLFVNRPLPDIESCKNMNVSTLGGVKFLQSTGGSVDTANNKTVWRFMTGSTYYYNSGIAVYYVKQS